MLLIKLHITKVFLNILMRKKPFPPLVWESQNHKMSGKQKPFSKSSVLWEIHTGMCVHMSLGKSCDYRMYLYPIIWHGCYSIVWWWCHYRYFIICPQPCFLSIAHEFWLRTYVKRAKLAWCSSQPLVPKESQNDFTLRLKVIAYK